MTAELVAIRLLGLPLDIHRAAVEHQENLRRELLLLSFDPGSAPQRLVQIADRNREQFGGFTADTTAELDDALSRGQETIDLTFRLPEEVGPAVVALRDLLDEVDEFCRNGGLLTIATPPEALVYRRWFLSEFLSQLDGHGPRPWDEWREEHARA